MKLKAMIPPTVVADWFLNHSVNIAEPAHKERIKELLNSPKYAYLTDPAWIASRQALKAA